MVLMVNCSMEVAKTYSYVNPKCTRMATSLATMPRSTSSTKSWVFMLFCWQTTGSVRNYIIVSQYYEGPQSSHPKCQAFRVPFLVPNSDMFLPVAHRRMREWGLQNVGKLFCIVAVLLDAAVRS